MEWEEVRTFLAVERNRTVTAAATELGCNPSTVTRRIAQLERRLKVKLFDRGSHGYATTRAGQELKRDAAKIEEQLVSLAHRVRAREKEARGKVIFSAPSGVTGRMIVPRLGEFYERYPGIELEIVDDDAPLDVTRRQADVVLRATNDPPSHLLGTKLGTSPARPYASSAYLKRRAQLECDWVVVGKGAHDRSWIDGLGRTRITLTSDCRELRIRAACSGLGLVHLAESVGDMEPGLERLPGDVPVTRLEIWLLTHPDLRLSEPVRAFKSFLVDLVERSERLVDA